MADPKDEAASANVPAANVSAANVPAAEVPAAEVPAADVPTPATPDERRPARGPRGQGGGGGRGRGRGRGGDRREGGDRGGQRDSDGMVENVVAINRDDRSEEHTSELQSRGHLVCRLLLEKKKRQKKRVCKQVAL